MYPVLATLEKYSLKLTSLDVEPSQTSFTWGQLSAHFANKWWLAPFVCGSNRSQWIHSAVKLQNCQISSFCWNYTVHMMRSSIWYGSITYYYIGLVHERNLLYIPHPMIYECVLSNRQQRLWYSNKVPKLARLVLLQVSLQPGSIPTC